jgi:hypothetical protein
MLYAQITLDAGKNYTLPMQWDKCDDMFRYLNRISPGRYKFIAERKMFQVKAPEYRCVLVRWSATSDRRYRDVLLETSDPKQMQIALFMLINEAETQMKTNERT